MSVSSQVARSGWLYRQSTMLKKWKRSWFVLSTDGLLRYFDTELSTKAEDLINIPADCVAIKVGPEVNVRKLHPPEGLSINLLMTLDSTNGNTWTLCGDSEDEVKAWQLAFQEAKQLWQRPPRSPSCPPLGVSVYPATTPVTTIVVDDSARRYGYPYGYGYGYGYGYPSGYSTRLMPYPPAVYYPQPMMYPTRSTQYTTTTTYYPQQ